jgi:hypothetical protein
MFPTCKNSQKWVKNKKSTDKYYRHLMALKIVTNEEPEKFCFENE